MLLYVHMKSEIFIVDCKHIKLGNFSHLSIIFIKICSVLGKLKRHSCLVSIIECLIIIY